METGAKALDQLNRELTDLNPSVYSRPYDEDGTYYGVNTMKQADFTEIVKR